MPTIGEATGKLSRRGSVGDRAARRRRVRVLHVIQNLNYGGMERLLADIVRGADHSRFESHVLALQYLGRFAEGLDEVALLHLADPMSAFSMLRPRALARQIARIGPDVVHTHSGVWYKASLAARMAGVPLLIHTEHGRRHPEPFSDRAIDAMAARRTNCIVAVSEHLGQQLVATGLAPAGRLHVISNGISTELFRPRADDGAIRGELNIPVGVPIIGSIGRLEQIKGFDVMIEAFASLLSRWRDEKTPVLVIAGEGSQRGRLEQLIDRYALRPQVRLLGWRNDACALHSAFTVFTMSSRSEGTSVSLLEAMSAGLCPIVTEVGGNSAVLGESLAHRLVPTENPLALAEALRAALVEAERRLEDGRLARARVASDFSLGAMIEAYQQLYSLPPETKTRLGQRAEPRRST
jgi:glycosyltransferase involved in cell wall biosynthesis